MTHQKQCAIEFSDMGSIKANHVLITYVHFKAEQMSDYVSMHAPVSMLLLEPTSRTAVFK